MAMFLNAFRVFTFRCRNDVSSSRVYRRAGDDLRMSHFSTSIILLQVFIWKRVLV